MKTTLKSIFALSLFALISLTSAFAGNNEVYNLETQAFKAEVTLPAQRTMELKFENSEAPVQVMLLSMEDGIVLIEDIDKATEQTQIDLQNLEDGEYMLQMEYKGEIMTRKIVITSSASIYDESTKTVNVSAQSDVTLISEKDGIVFFEGLDAGSELDFSNIEEGDYILLIETENQTLEQNITL